MAAKTAEAMPGTQSTAELGGKYLTFQLGHEVYGLEILKVQEIIKMLDITKVPRTPAFVRGVINLRGKVIPVVDIRLKFGMEQIDTTEKTCIIVVQVTRDGEILTIGIIVDEVSEVSDIAGGDIEPPPSFGTTIDTNFILGMAKSGNRVRILLDIDKILSTGEIESIDVVDRHAPAEQAAD
jgi:purine-binding chemotaxis protein CheW